MSLECRWGQVVEPELSWTSSNSSSLTPPADETFTTFPGCFVEIPVYATAVWYKVNSNSHGARPVHLIITMIKWSRTSRRPSQPSPGALSRSPCTPRPCGTRFEPRNPEPETRTPNTEARDPKPETRTPNPETRNPKPEPPNPEPETRTPNPGTRNPNPETRNPEPGTRNPKPETRNPKPET